MPKITFSPLASTGFAVKLLRKGSIALAAILLATYLYAMVLFPLVESGGDWLQMQAVWDRWQGFNVGVLALLTSIVVYLATTLRERRRQMRSFQAAKAALPSMLSELHAFGGSCFSQLKEAYRDSVLREANHTPPNLSPRPSMPKSEVPGTPIGLSSVFADCIKHSESDELVVDLSDILAMVQILLARLRELYADPPITEALFRTNLVYRMYDLGELLVLVNRLFPLARGIGERNSDAIQLDEFMSAYLSHSVEPTSYKVTDELTLKAISEQRLNRGKVPQLRTNTA